MAVSYLTLYLPGSSQGIQVSEGGQLHQILVSMGANSVPSAPGETVRKDPYPQYVDADELATALAGLGGGGGGGGGAVDSVNGQTGTVVLAAGDVGAATPGYVDAGDTAAKARANHTGTQAAATISDLTETVQDIVGALIVAGTGATVSYDDAAGTFTISATGGTGGTTDPEVVRDVIGTAMVAGAGIQITVNDAGDTITVASTAVLPTRKVNSGTGLSGGGDLSADRTLAVVYGTTAGTAAQGNDGRLSDARTPLAHTHPVGDLTATGTRDATTFLRGDNTWAVPAGGSATLTGLRRRDLPSPLIWAPATSTDAPTVTTGGPGGSPGFAGTYNVYPYNTAQVTRLGCLATPITALGSNYMQNTVSGATGSGATPWAVEFDHYGADIALVFRNAVTNGSYFWVWVEGRPATAAPVLSSANSANSQYFLNLHWTTSALRRVRIYMAGMDQGDIIVGHAETISATPRPASSIAVIGDSWIAGTGATSPLSAMAVTLGRILGVETYLGGFGGTGYVSQGTPTFAAYGEAVRVNPLGTVLPDYTLLLGSINDSSVASATVGSAASSAYSAIKAAAPATKVIVASVQAISGSMSAGNTANDTAIANAATAAGVYGLIRPITEGWITGTGRVGALTGTGNADVFIGSDAVHPTQAGHDYYARRLARSIAALLPA